MYTCLQIVSVLNKKPLFLKYFLLFCIHWDDNEKKKKRQCHFSVTTMGPSVSLPSVSSQNTFFSSDSHENKIHFCFVLSICSMPLFFCGNLHFRWGSVCRYFCIKQLNCSIYVLVVDNGLIGGSGWQLAMIKFYQVLTDTEQFLVEISAILNTRWSWGTLI